MNKYTKTIFGFLAASFICLAGSCQVNNSMREPKQESADKPESANTMAVANSDEPPMAQTGTQHPNNWNVGDTGQNSIREDQPAEKSDLKEFPFPPLKASALAEISPTLLRNANGAETKFYDVSEKLSNALNMAGYEQTGFYSYKGNGFALVTQLEQFDPKTGNYLADNNQRYSNRVPPPSMFSIDYFTSLIQGKTGHFRVLAFLVTDRPLTRGDRDPTFDEGGALLGGGASNLNRELGEQIFTPNHKCWALIYEFTKSGSESTARFVANSSLPARWHLSPIWEQLERH